MDPSKNEPDKDIIIEIRAGTGGLEASLFAGDLYRMYTKYADLKGWKLELMSYVDTEAGGVKEVVFSLSGKECSKRLKWESGIASRPARSYDRSLRAYPYISGHGGYFI